MATNSEKLSQLICPSKSNEPLLAHADAGSRNGILIGVSQKYSMPAFLNLGEAMNPHMLVCGMTGSGKTYLTRSILMRLLSFCDASAAVIDFTGEYARTAQHFSGLSTAQSRLFSEEQCFSYLDMHLLGDAGKVSAACDALDHMAALMRQRRQGCARQAFIVLDEAWKLVDRSRGLEVIIREGRKYGVGLITSSQLLHDANPNILSNVATMFMFRTTNSGSIEAVARSYNLSREEASTVNELDRGSCLMISLYKSGLRAAFTIKRVIGVEDVDVISIFKGSKMEISIGMREFNTLLNSLCTPEGAEKVKAVIKDSRIELPDLILRLVEAGADRRRILAELHNVGISYSDLADSFAMALRRVEVA